MVITWVSFRTVRWHIYFLKKNHAAIVLHKTIEADDAGICHSNNIRSEHNFAYLLTKAVTGKTF